MIWTPDEQRKQMPPGIEYYLEQRLQRIEDWIKAHGPLGCVGHCDPALQGPSEHEPYSERESNP